MSGSAREPQMLIVAHSAVERSATSTAAAICFRVGPPAPAVGCAAGAAPGTAIAAAVSTVVASARRIMATIPSP